MPSAVPGWERRIARRGRSPSADAGGPSSAQEQVLTRLLSCDMGDLACCFTNPLVPGNPIVHVNTQWERLTGISSQEAVGSNPRILQGRATDAAVTAQLSSTLAEGRACKALLLNYRREGANTSFTSTSSCGSSPFSSSGSAAECEPFWSMLIMSPVLLGGEVILWVVRAELLLCLSPAPRRLDAPHARSHPSHPSSHPSHRVPALPQSCLQDYTPHMAPLKASSPAQFCRSTAHQQRRRLPIDMLSPASLRAPLVYDAGKDDSPTGPTPAQPGGNATQPSGGSTGGSTGGRTGSSAVPRGVIDFQLMPPARPPPSLPLHRPVPPEPPRPVVKRLGCYGLRLEPEVLLARVADALKQLEVHHTLSTMADDRGAEVFLVHATFQIPAEGGMGHPESHGEEAVGVHVLITVCEDVEAAEAMAGPAYKITCTRLRGPTLAYHAAYRRLLSTMSPQDLASNLATGAAGPASSGSATSAHARSRHDTSCGGELLGGQGDGGTAGMAATGLREVS